MPEVVEQLLAKTLQALEQRARPAATYRWQFHSGFTFQDAARLVPYLADLGVTHCYASPYLQSRPGSQHGYDITDHRVLNGDIGSEADYDRFTAALAERGLGQILDVVPNHMGVVGNANPWWNDVLENGPASPYASYFDITWDVSPRPELQGRVLVPILGEPFAKVLEAQQLKLIFDAGAFAVHYFDHRFPISPRSTGLILNQRFEELERSLPANSPVLMEYQSILTAVKNLPRRTATDPSLLAERQREKEVIKRRLAALTAESAAVREFVEQTVTALNGRPGEPRSFDALETLLDDQAYRLAYWRVASDEINYRRFFDINDLAAVSMEREEVFNSTHELVLRLLWEGKVVGLRIDHPDGLYDPREYLARLQTRFLHGLAERLFAGDPAYAGLVWKDVDRALEKAVADKVRSGAADHCNWPLYVVVEKILTGDETLPADWATCGTTGYEFLNRLNGLFVEAGNGPAFTRLYQEWTGDDTPLAELIYQKKRLIMQIALASELHMLAHQLDRLAQRHRSSRDFTTASLRVALREIIASFPVYRTYISGEPFTETDRRHVLQAVRRAMSRNPALSTSLFVYVRDMLLLRAPEGVDNDYRAEQRRFVGKFQQLTGPVMAKGVEDTAFYVYHRLTALNEVGGDPDRFGTSPAALHQFLQERQSSGPWALSATATHDTKRGEDVRTRLAVLSEIPDEWRQRALRWRELNQQHKAVDEDGTAAPDANEEYLLYQTLLGAWPLDAAEEVPFVKRIQDYMRKALHEAKVHTSWINPNEAYDAAVGRFIERILDPQASAEFLADFRAFQQRVSHYGLFNSLAQVLVKIAAPGVCDFYQGTELWDFRLVDPDNRQPVDYERRSAMLKELQQRAKDAGTLPQLARELIDAKDDGRAKLYLTWRALHCRRTQPALFTKGAYVPLTTAGARAEHAFAFARRHEQHAAVAIVPRLLTRLAPSAGESPLGADVWGDTTVELPGEFADRRWTNALTGEIVHAADGKLTVAAACAQFPVALLTSTPA